MPSKSLKATDYAFTNLLSWCAYNYPRFLIGAHHRLIAKALEKVERGEIKRLMINMPPRHGKSFLASEFFPAWYLGRNPDKYIIAASHTKELSDDFGRKVRNLLLDDPFRAVFNTTISVDSQAAAKFSMAKGGMYYGAGVGTGISGKGAHLFLIDDPIKDRESAESPLYRRRLKDWYSSTAERRLMPNAAIVVIQTRWHEDDLSGWLLETEADEWTVLSFPALDHNEDALWPDFFDKAALLSIRDKLIARGQSREWNALYQQNPTPAEGVMFKATDVTMYNDLPEGCTFYMASDYAVTPDQGDYTVHSIFAVDNRRNVYLHDMWRGQKESRIWVNALLNLVRKYKPMAGAEEKGQILKTLEPYIVSEMNRLGIYWRRIGFASVGSKEQRASASKAQSFSGLVSQGKFYVRSNQNWTADFMDELTKFPYGKHDDMIDTCTLFMQMFAGLREGEKPMSDLNANQMPTFNQLVKHQNKSYD